MIEPYKVAWGSFSRSCASVEKYLQQSCIGCEDAGSVGIVLMDTGSAATALCALEPHVYTLLAAPLLPVLPPSDPKSKWRHWPVTQALFTQMLRLAPHATYYLKVDFDALLNLRALRVSLPYDGHADYVGKVLRIFRFQSRPLYYMQGGMYVLSRCAAREVSKCILGAWADCPADAFNEINSKGERRLRSKFESTWRVATASGGPSSLVNKSARAESQ